MNKDVIKKNKEMKTKVKHYRDIIRDVNSGVTSNIDITDSEEEYSEQDNEESFIRKHDPEKILYKTDKVIFKLPTRIKRVKKQRGVKERPSPPLRPVYN